MRRRRKKASWMVINFLFCIRFFEISFAKTVRFFFIIIISFLIMGFRKDIQIGMALKSWLIAIKILFKFKFNIDLEVLKSPNFQCIFLSKEIEFEWPLNVFHTIQTNFEIIHFVASNIIHWLFHSLFTQMNFLAGTIYKFILPIKNIFSKDNHR